MLLQMLIKPTTFVVGTTALLVQNLHKERQKIHHAIH